jgi:hypothetical protein
MQLCTVTDRLRAVTKTTMLPTATSFTTVDEGASGFFPHFYSTKTARQRLYPTQAQVPVTKALLLVPAWKSSLFLEKREQDRIELGQKVAQSSAPVAQAEWPGSPH